VKEGNVILLIPASLEQHFDHAGLQERAAQLTTRLGYSLLPLLQAVREAS